jgi:hypothetical protein
MPGTTSADPAGATAEGTPRGAAAGGTTGGRGGGGGMAAGLRRRAFSLWTEKPLISLDDDDDNLRYGNGHAWDEGDQASRETPKAKTKKGDKKKNKKTKKKPAVKSESDGGKNEESEEDQEQKKKEGKKKKVKQSKKAAGGGEGLSAGGGEGDGDVVGLPRGLKAGAPLDAEMTKAEKEINDQHQSQAPGAQAPDETGRDKRSIAKALLGRYPFLLASVCSGPCARAVLRVRVVRSRIEVCAWPVAGQ